MKKALLTIILVAGCVSWMAVSVPAAETITIGAIVPLTGGTAYYGTVTKRGLEMSIDEINSKGGVKVKDKSYLLKLEACDDEGKSDKAAICGRKLAQTYNVPIIFCPASWSAFPLMGFNEKMNFIIMATSQSPDFTVKGNSMVIRWINSIETSIGPWTKSLMNALKKRNLDVKKVGVMEANTEVGKRWAGAFMTEWVNNGGVITSKESYDANATDFYSQLTSTLAKNPDAILSAGGVDEPASLMFRQARELGFKGIFISSAAVSGEVLLTLIKPEWVENTFMEALAWALPIPEVDALKAKYAAQFKGEQPLLLLGLSYEAVIAIKKAIEKAQSLEPKKIRDAFPSILPLPDCMFCGRDMNAQSGDVYFPTYLRMIKDGKLVYIKEE